MRNLNSKKWSEYKSCVFIKMCLFQLTLRELLSTEGGNICIHTIQPQFQNEGNDLRSFRVEMASEELKTNRKILSPSKFYQTLVEGAEML